jgi:hypothetical protein
MTLFPLSLAERGQGVRGVEAPRSPKQILIANSLEIVRVSSPLIPRPLLRKGEGETRHYGRIPKLLGPVSFIRCARLAHSQSNGRVSRGSMISSA